MAKPRSNTVQLTLRIPSVWIDDADEFAALLSAQTGCQISRTDAFRAAIGRVFQEFRTIREKKSRKGK